MTTPATPEEIADLRAEADRLMAYANSLGAVAQTTRKNLVELQERLAQALGTGQLDGLDALRSQIRDDELTLAGMPRAENIAIDAYQAAEAAWAAAALPGFQSAVEEAVVAFRLELDTSRTAARQVAAALIQYRRAYQALPSKDKAAATAPNADAFLGQQGISRWFFANLEPLTGAIT